MTANIIRTIAVHNNHFQDLSMGRTLPLVSTFFIPYYKPTYAFLSGIAIELAYAQTRRRLLSNNKSH
jgi:hypothetical protein